MGKNCRINDHCYGGNCTFKSSSGFSLEKKTCDSPPPPPPTPPPPPPPSSATPSQQCDSRIYNSYSCRQILSNYYTAVGYARQYDGGQQALTTAINNLKRMTGNDDIINHCENLCK